MEPLKLKVEVKERWLTKLRSGEYGQCKKRLADGEGNYCCLGVLSEVAVEDGVIRKRVSREVEILPEGDEGPIVFYGEATTVLPRGLAEWAYENLSEYGGDPVVDPRSPENPTVWITDVLGIRRQASLAELNDSGMTFDKIADLIEEHL